MTAKVNESPRQLLLELIDMLPDRECIGAYHALMLYVRQTDPVLWALVTAPEDDEPLTEEDIAAIEEAKAEIQAGNWISHEELERELRDSL